MRIFELKKPVLDKIESVVEAYLIETTQTKKFLYLDYEPDEGYIQSRDCDGAVCVYAAEISFPSGTGSNTGTQNSDNILIVDCYGFGDPVPDSVDPEKFEPTTREAENKAEILTTLVYKSIMDRREVSGSPAVGAVPAIPKWFGTDIDITDRYPQRIQKFPNMGTMDDLRGICAFRSMYKFEQLVEDVPSEPLGLPFAGSDDITSDTYNPGDEPEL